MEDAGDIGARAAFREDIAVGVGLDLALENLGVGDMADGQEEAVHFLVPDLARLEIAQADAGDQFLRYVVDFFDHGVQQELDLWDCCARGRA